MASPTRTGGLASESQTQSSEMSRLGGVQLQILELDDVARLRRPSTPVINQNFHMTALFEVWTTGVLSFYTHTYTHTNFPIRSAYCFRNGQTYSGSGRDQIR